MMRLIEGKGERASPAAHKDHVRGALTSQTLFSQDMRVFDPS